MRKKAFGICGHAAKVSWASQDLSRPSGSLWKAGFNEF
jgi:hypothetical protein